MASTTRAETSGQSPLDRRPIRRDKRPKPMRIRTKSNEISSSIGLLLPLAFVSSYYLLRAALQVAGTGGPALVIVDHRQPRQQRQLQQIGHPLQVHGRRYSARQQDTETAELETGSFAPTPLPAARPLEPLPSAERLYLSRQAGEYRPALTGSSARRPLSGSIFLAKIFLKLMSRRRTTHTHTCTQH